MLGEVKEGGEATLTSYSAAFHVSRFRVALG